MCLSFIILQLISKFIIAMAYRMHHTAIPLDFSWNHFQSFDLFAKNLNKVERKKNEKLSNIWEVPENIF